MKHYQILFCLLTSIAGIKGHAQGVYLNKLAVTDSKTTSIVFPGIIKSVDLGSLNIIAQKVNGTENILQIKAARPSFPETNLTVITDKGTLHQFDVSYSTVPASCYFVVNSNGHFNPIEVSFKDRESAAFFEKAYESIKADLVGTSTSVKESGITVVLNDLYIVRDKIFFPIVIVNDSFLPFDLQSIRFFIRDKKLAKRTAIQEVEITPVHFSTQERTVPANGSLAVILAFDKFTISKKKLLAIDVSESNGSRNLAMKLKSKRINKAIPVKQ